MNGMNRKQRRALERASEAEQALTTKVALFGLLPEKCNTCEEPFDKTKKEMVMTWSVVVHQEAEKVRLFCPQCIEKAQKTIKETENVD
tara:strand:+ start:411 stop:674 length:264 start_codon:yes stop_codon:yes gene_type:complete